MGKPASNAEAVKPAKPKQTRKPAAKRKGVQIAFRLTEEEANLVKTEASKRDMRLSTFVRHLLDEHMRHVRPHSVTSEPPINDENEATNESTQGD